MAVDTGDLTDKTYDAIIVAAEQFNHDLTLQFGLLSYDSEDEKDFIAKTRLLVNEMLKYDEVDLHDLFFGNPPTKNDFHKALHTILNNISKL